MSQLALSALFEYLCYGSTAIINILLFHQEDENTIYVDDSRQSRRLFIRTLPLISVIHDNRFILHLPRAGASSVITESQRVSAKCAATPQHDT